MYILSQGKVVMKKRKIRCDRKYDEIQVELLIIQQILAFFVFLCELCGTTTFCCSVGEA